MEGEAMTDEEVAAEIQRRGLEVEYLRELAAVLGYAESEGWSAEVVCAIEAATYAQRRAAAERAIRLG